MKKTVSQHSVITNLVTTPASRQHPSNPLPPIDNKLIEHEQPTAVLSSSKVIKRPKVASQFKSPLSDPLLAKSATLSSVRLTPTIQSLERKIQILKRAVKVKADGEEEILSELVKKWTEAGREVAWDVWSLVKDSGGDPASTGGRKAGDWGEDERQGKKRSFEEGWGWDDREAKKPKTDDSERNWGWSTEPKDQDEGYGADDEYNFDSRNRNCGEMPEDDDERVEDTLGTMLRQLGIDPETFGWNEGEGEFTDSC